MPQKKGALDRIRDRLQANRNRLTYVLLLLGGLLGLATPSRRPTSGKTPSCWRTWP